MAVFETRMSLGSKFLLLYYNLCHCFNYVCKRMYEHNIIIKAFYQDKF